MRKTIEEVVEEVLNKHPFVVKYKSGGDSIVDFDYMKDQVDELRKTLTQTLQAREEALLAELEEEMSALFVEFDCPDCGKEYEPTYERLFTDCPNCGRKNARQMRPDWNIFLSLISSKRMK